MKLLTRLASTKKEESVKFLGIYIDKHLTWKEHTDIISSKIARAIFAINRMTHFIPHKALKSLCCNLIHTHITYDIQAWDDRNIRKLDFLQKRDQRRIKNKGYRSHTDPIFTSEKNIENLRCV